MSHGDYKDFFRGACEGDLELVRHHLRRGVDVDFIHPELLSTALVAAIEVGRAEVALVLLDHGADPALRSPLEGMTPLEAAEADLSHTTPTRVAAPRFPDPLASDLVQPAGGLDDGAATRRPGQPAATPP